MTADLAPQAFEDEAAADLTALGKHLEILRIQRGLSKQGLARTAGTSRQQLWRVMTGKSELTAALKQRLAGALAVDAATLSPTSTTHVDATFPVHSPAPTPPLSMADYLVDLRHLATTLRTLPSSDCGGRLKRALFAAIEEFAAESGLMLPVGFKETHQRVLAGDL